MNRSEAVRALRPIFESHPALKRTLVAIDSRVFQWQHSLGARFPAIIQPSPRQVTVAITARCNLRCMGCRYGRDFMIGEQLPREIVLGLIDDAAEAGINTIRFFGGEPLLHPALPDFISHATGCGMKAYITSNGILLKDKIDELFAAGLRLITIGFYGENQAYDEYVQKQDRYSRLEASLASIREGYGDTVELQLNYLLMRDSCNLASLSAAWHVAQRHRMFLSVDLISYSIPFFTNDPSLRLFSGDISRLREVVAELIRLKQAYPDRFPQSLPTIRSIPDWLLKGAEMRVPCDAYEQVFVNADGTVQLCEVTFPLGNLHKQRLREMLFSREHQRAARDAFALKCPNCTCRINPRILKNPAARARYS